MRVVVAVGGSVLAPEDPERVAEHAVAIERLAEAGHDVGVVVGGGSVARDYIESARELDANEIQLDDIGIAVTRLNARVLAAALDGLAAPVPAETYEEARAALARDEVALMGGTVAGHTTDAVSAALAEYVNADRLVYATSVPGVFDADPNVDPDATRFDSLTPAELVDVIAGIEMAAGSSAPVDLLAAKLIERSGLHAVVLDGTDPQRIVRAVLDGEHDGTDVVPETA
ncbi:MAG: UMP kinase [Halobacteriaceae archaeon]